MVELKQLEELHPLQRHEEKLKFLSNFNWNKSVLNFEQKSKVEDLFFEFNDIFAGLRFDVGWWKRRVQNQTYAGKTQTL